MPSVVAADAPALLELRDVRKSYGNVEALGGVTANVSGQVIGLLGPNGAGKSTLLKCMLGLTPHQGEATVLGLSTRSEPFRIRDRVGYMPEADSYLADLTAVELCAFAAELSGLPRSEAMQRAHAALYYAGLEEKRYLKVEGYSTGMKQRVKLAQALVHDPELLFLDEPTNGLDPRARDEMLELILDLPHSRGCSIILSTHLLPDVDRICDQVVIMHRGLIRFSGSIEELRRGGPVADARLHVYDVEIKAGEEAFAAALAASRLLGREEAAAPPGGAPARRGRLHHPLPAGAGERGADPPPGAEPGLARGGVPPRGGRAHRRRGAVASMSRSGHHASAGRPAAAIHDLGYKRYVGTRRPQKTRWRVLVRNTVATAWRGWWRMKAWVIGAAMNTVVFGVLIYYLKGDLVRRAGIPVLWSDALLPYSVSFFALFGFLLACTTAAGAVARDLRAGAFEFYFSRPVRPSDYLLGKVAGSVLVVATAMMAGPVLLALFRVGLATEELDQLLEALALVPRMALVGALGSIAFAVVALAFSSLSSRPRITIAMWVAFYFLFGSLWEGIALLVRSPDLAALSVSSAVEGLAFGLVDVRLPGFAPNPPGIAVSYASLLVHTAVGLVILHLRVRRAERAGLGGG